MATKRSRIWAAVFLAAVVVDCALTPTALAMGRGTCGRTPVMLDRRSAPSCPAVGQTADVSVGNRLLGAPIGVPGLPGLPGVPGLPGLPGLPGPLGNPVASLGQGVTSIASTAATNLALATIGTWVSGAATFVLHETAHVLDATTAPRLDSTWFSAAYWRVAGIAAVLTLPFLFAACAQAMIRSDLTLLLRAALGYLPLAMLTVAIAAPLTMLLLSASDQLSAAVSSAAGHRGVDFLDGVAGPLGAIGVISGSPFLAFLMALATVGGALTLWIELLIREAAVYVIVLMLPLVFAAFVWPARRVWALRSVELLVALILSKFAIVAVLSLGGAALAHGVSSGLAAVLAGVVLLILGAFAPWALLRLLPLAEITSGTAGALRGHAGTALGALHQADDWATYGQRWATRVAQMRRTAVAGASVEDDATDVDAEPRTVGSPWPREAVVSQDRSDDAASTTTSGGQPGDADRPPTAEPAPPTWIRTSDTVLDPAGRYTPPKAPRA